MPDTDLDNDTFIAEEEIHRQLNEDFRNPRQQFKGKPLAPYNQSYRMLALAAREPSDDSDFFILLFVYILIRGEEIYQAALERYKGNTEAAEDAVDLELPMEIQGSIPEFRAKVFKWIRHFSKEDVDEAVEILLEAAKKSQASKVQGRDPDRIEEETGSGK